MAIRQISYPADYENDRKLRREHRGGCALVIILSLLVVGLSVVSMALTARGATLVTPKTAQMIVEQIEPLIPPTLKDNGESTVPEAPVATPAPQKTAEQTAAPAKAEPSPTPYIPNPTFMDTAASPFTETFEALPDIVDAVAPGVVSVINWQTLEDLQRVVEYGSGSGFVITTDGYILTNQHVIEDAERITVDLHNGEKYDAVLIGADKTSDVAVLKIDATGLTALPKGDSEAIRVGEFVLAIGDPVQTELSGSVTFGIISAKSRCITIDGIANNYIQIDAAINFGNSGGPLIDMNGNVIGMNSAKTITAGYDSMGRTISAEGIGFALPINRVWEIATQLITTGKVERPGIGVTIAQRNANYAMEDEEIRPYIQSVTEGGPADQAGIQVNDVLLGVDGIEMSDYSEFVNYIQQQTKVGQKIVFTVEREGQTLELTVTVGDLNQLP
ncbi:MAG: trypsin-like peptidase domain-containing protein [Clostridia bacterium]|nr:trypsin-like peptidase domain-containing protein [Clostridia bacterium]